VTPSPSVAIRRREWVMMGAVVAMKTPPFYDCKKR